MYSLGYDETVDIKEAPPKELLRAFGGEMTIENYRRRFTMINKEYLVYIPPIKPINIIVEERNVDTTNNYNDKKYILKRSKPLSKKHSIISSLKINFDNDDDD